ncbi:long-chain-fatty-acid--CoA ligase [Nocardioides fonticola]|uniref:Long-chain-fatty-acid--CoA ligase n=1 Tax=Nocardioides fonticola TaxID=450363 RepID=A0ABP7Y0V8_9ACTN
MTAPPPTVREQLLARRDDAGNGLLGDGVRLTWAETVATAARWSSALRALLAELAPGRPPHVGVLLENRPEYLHLLAAAGLGGVVAVGLNPTRRGAALAGDCARADVALVLTDAAHAHLLPDGALPEGAVVDIDGEEWAALVAAASPEPADLAVGPDDLMMLIFTSGTSGDPKAVRITQAKVAAPGVLLGERFGLGSDDVAYVSMPLFHSNAVMAGWAPALAQGAGVAVARFSASGFLPDVRRFGATYANYVGKPLSYVLTTPPHPDDADNPLRIVFGNEADERSIAAFGERFGCTVVDSYSSTENAVIVRREPGMPAGALGRPAPGVRVLDPETLAETPDAVFDDHGRLLNAEEATGELVNTEGAGAFAGYYNDPDAEADRMRHGMYWSGDLAYRDAEGWIYFAGRTADWLRVDGENLAAAPIERVLLRHPAITSAAVYAVPDPGDAASGAPGIGDQVMAAIVAPDLSPAAFAGFLDDQDDLSPKARPRWVRVHRAVDELPRTATTKIIKRDLAAAGVAGATASGGVLWEREPRGTAYRVRP